MVLTFAAQACPAAAAYAAYKRFPEENLGTGGLCLPVQVKYGVPMKSMDSWGSKPGYEDQKAQLEGKLNQ